MDLIDRTKVERITFQEPSYSDPINVLTEVRDKVRALPTVEAIPVEWLEDFRDGLDTLSESRLMLAVDLIIDAYRVEKKRNEE